MPQFIQTSGRPLRLREPVICPWCRKDQDTHPKTYECEFRFADADTFSIGGTRIILAWYNDHLLGTFAHTERGYALALITLEEQVQRSHDGSAWRIKMDNGMPRAWSKRVARLQLIVVKVME